MPVELLTDEQAASYGTFNEGADPAGAEDAGGLSVLKAGAAAPAAGAGKGIAHARTGWRRCC
ncbi:hypothetical protein [Streptomyces zagrosensis]|uniref:Uncharacterized protein n=1 Tax=Streptomyces zagrosensis TaxID=1042984 RepID=A0A7W9Q6Z4_9ACTN|nr:hypothetical protein [Streptomyces zagrosensis]MBB5934705.1 hypothetical protein [Streptomyces zagrosensis]